MDFKERNTIFKGLVYFDSNLESSMDCIKNKSRIVLWGSKNENRTSGVIIFREGVDSIQKGEKLRATIFAIDKTILESDFQSNGKINWGSVAEKFGDIFVEELNVHPSLMPSLK